MIKQKISLYPETKKKYLEYIKSQEINGELFKNKIEQFNNFYVPISQIISRNYLKKKKRKSYWFSWGTRIWKINYIKYFKDYIKNTI